MAGLLTYSLSKAFPSAGWRTVAREFRKHVNELTAAGTVQDFHPIPILSPKPQGLLMDTKINAKIWMFWKRMSGSFYIYKQLFEQRFFTYKLPWG